MKVSIVIPVFNEAKTIRELLTRVWNQELPGFEKELIVVESNSTDPSRTIVQEFAASKAGIERPSLKLVFQDSPRGKGAAVREGFSHATGDIILIQDADLEYRVEDYPLLLLPILEGQADFVLGSRHLAAGTWKIRRFERNTFKSLILNFGGVAFHGLFNLLYGQKLTDPTTMYKVFKRKCLDGLLLESNRFDFDFELLGKLIRAGYPPIEVPVSYTSRGFEDGKKVTFIRDPLTWIVAIFKYRFSRLRVRARRGVTSVSASTTAIEPEGRGQSA